MNEVRRAGADDAWELVRLRGVMYAGESRVLPEPGPWQSAAAETLRRRLADPGGPVAAFVVDKPEPPARGGRELAARGGRELAARGGRELAARGGRELAARGGRELAACAIGAIDWRLPGPNNPADEVGYVLNVATDFDCRRRGYSRACMGALLAWYRGRGVVRVDLRASAEAEPLYVSLGFEVLPAATLRLRMDV